MRIHFELVKVSLDQLHALTHVAHILLQCNGSLLRRLEDVEHHVPHAYFKQVPVHLWLLNTRE